MRLGFSLAIGGQATVAASPAPTPAMQPYTLLTSFESSTGWASTNASFSLGTGTRVALGSGALAVSEHPSSRLAGMSVTNVVNSTYTHATVAGWANDVIAICVDVGDFDDNNLNNLRPQFTGTSNFVYTTPTFSNPPLSGLTITPFAEPQTMRGKVWRSFAVDRMRIANYSGISAPNDPNAYTKRLDIFFNGDGLTGTGSTNVDGFIDACIRVPRSDHKSVILLTFDDNNITQYTNMVDMGDGLGVRNRSLFQLMKERGLVGTLCPPKDLVRSPDGVTNPVRMSLAEIQDMVANGWGVINDSRGNDDPVTRWETRRTGIDELNLNRDWLIANFGAAGVAGAPHFCYSYGAFGYPIDPQSLLTSGSVTGADTVTFTSNLPFQAIRAGMRAVWSGGSAIVRDVPAQNQVRFTTNVTIGNAVTVRFLARARGFGLSGHTATGASNENTQLTLSLGHAQAGYDTTTITNNLFEGMHMFGKNVPTDCKILTIVNGTTIIVSGTVPSTVTRVNFGYKDGEFWHNKMLDDLMAEGYKFGRTTLTSSGFFDRYGLDPKFKIRLPAVSLDQVQSSDAVLADYLNFLDAAIEDRMSIAFYAHFVNSSSPLTAAQITRWGTFFDRIALRKSENAAIDMNIPAYEAALALRLPIA